uniref:Transposase n=1 Tax=Romanomermis culicivorax TaxID=13658 RepID=A0A915IRJ0_ROMCU
MLKRVTTFQKEWMDPDLNPDWAFWVRPGRLDTEASCTYCKKEFSVSTMGHQALSRPCKRGLPSIRFWLTVFRRYIPIYTHSHFNQIMDQLDELTIYEFLRAEAPHLHVTTDDLRSPNANFFMHVSRWFVLQIIGCMESTIDKIQPELMSLLRNPDHFQNSMVDCQIILA